MSWTSYCGQRPLHFIYLLINKQGGWTQHRYRVLVQQGIETRNLNWLCSLFKEAWSLLSKYSTPPFSQERTRRGGDLDVERGPTGLSHVQTKIVIFSVALGWFMPFFGEIPPLRPWRQQFYYFIKDLISL